MPASALARGEIRDNCPLTHTHSLRRPEGLCLRVYQGEPISQHTIRAAPLIKLQKMALEWKVPTPGLTDMGNHEGTEIEGTPGQEPQPNN